MFSPSNRVLIDYQKVDYRGFIFVVHDQHGLMLLHCTRKKNKPPHWQVPGGHIDEAEYKQAARESSDRDTQLLRAARAGAARELVEETGINVRDQLDRMQPVVLGGDVGGTTQGALSNELKHRLFFSLTVTDDDFPSDGHVAPMDTKGISNLKLRLSIEHSGFTFEPEPEKAIEMLQHHSGGKISQALKLSMERGNAWDMYSSPVKRTISRRRSKFEKDESFDDDGKVLDLLNRKPRKSASDWFCC